MLSFRRSQWPFIIFTIFLITSNNVFSRCRSNAFLYSEEEIVDVHATSSTSSSPSTSDAVDEYCYEDHNEDHLFHENICYEEYRETVGIRKSKRRQNQRNGGERAKNKLKPASRRGSTKSNTSSNTNTTARTTTIRGCLGPLYGSSINWNAIGGWIKYHEKRWGLTHVDIFIPKMKDNDDDNNNEESFFSFMEENIRRIVNHLEAGSEKEKEKKKDNGFNRTHGEDPVTPILTVEINISSIIPFVEEEKNDVYRSGDYEENPEILYKYHTWFINECLSNAKIYKNDFLIQFNANEFLISDDFQTVSDIFRYNSPSNYASKGGKRKDKNNTRFPKDDDNTTMYNDYQFSGVAFPTFLNNYHRCSSPKPSYGSATYHSVIPFGSKKKKSSRKKAGPDNNDKKRKKETGPLEVQYTKPEIGIRGQRKYIVIPGHFETLKGLYDPIIGDVHYNEKEIYDHHHLNTNIFYPTGRKEENEHARIIQFQTYNGIHNDMTDLPCHVVIENCRFLKEDGTCAILKNNVDKIFSCDSPNCGVENMNYDKLISSADYENIHNSVNAILSSLKFNTVVQEMYDEAICYAKRYPDLYKGFCRDDNNQCRLKGLKEHFDDHGKNQNLIWGCHNSVYNRNTTYAKTIIDSISLDDMIHIHFQELYLDPINDNNINVLIYETDEEVAKHILVDKQCRLAGLNTILFGVGEKYLGHGSQWISALPILKKLNQEEIEEQQKQQYTKFKTTLVVLIDSRDVLLNIHKDDIVAASVVYDDNDDEKDGAVNLAVRDAIQRFIKSYRALTLNRPGAVVMSTEAVCCVSALTYVKPGAYFNVTINNSKHNSRSGLTRNIRACSSGYNDNCTWGGDAYRLRWEYFQQNLAKSRTGGHDLIDVYLNSGMVTGKLIDLIHFLESVNLEPAEDDQAVFTDYMYHKPDRVVLDYAHEMFGNARFSQGMEGGGCLFDPPASSNTTTSSLSTKNGKSNITTTTTSFVATMNTIDITTTAAAYARKRYVRSLIHRESKAYPLFLHTPGKFFECYNLMSDYLQARELVGLNGEHD